MTWQPNKLEQERLDKASQLESAGIALYPRRAHRTHTTASAIAQYIERELQEHDGQNPLMVSVCGRIRRVNIKGKVSFMHIEDESGRLQLFIRIDDVGEAIYQHIKNKNIDMDDFVQASGTMMRTKAGEISVRVDALILLAKSLSPLPVIKQKTLDDGRVIEYGEFNDVEQRYRQRYADLAVNHEVRDVFKKRSKTLRALRDFLDGEGFLEVETPILQPVYGGAAARPFTTYHNELGQNLFLRISFELYLKRLLVGGYDAVYEIGRDFRNEGVSRKHNPEFTMLEFYKAYVDYRDVMTLTERMVAYTAEQVNGSMIITYQGETIDLTPPWTRKTIREVVREYVGLDYMDYPDAELLTVAIHERLGIEIPPGETWGRIIVEHLLGRYVEPKLIQPTFILDYPRDVSPFAKRAESDDLHVERFELFIAGMEMGNAFTELNDPRDQEQRFIEMAALYRADADESTPIDEDYLRAMRYGMPPNGGFGMGIDRLVMLLTDQRSIRDVLLYPHMRDEK